jgi:hypothetical protein
MQLNKDIRNIAAPASTYGENALIESAQKKLITGLIPSENEVTKLNSVVFIYKTTYFKNIAFINYKVKFDF